LTTAYGGELASTWVKNLLGEAGRGSGCLVKSRKPKNANKSELALAA
jgi:hypothetical protein